MPYFDRLDYVSTIIQEHLYAMSIEKILNFKKPSTLVITRTVFDELTRILNHMLAVACHALDVGSMSPIFWSFEERERIMEFYERISGARMHTAFYKPIFSNKCLDLQLCTDILEFSQNCFTTLNEMHNTLTNNKVWRVRLVGVGSYDINISNFYGLTGVMLRCTGVKRDLRISKFNSYNNYRYLNICSYVSNNGDSYDRYLLRMFEMVESLNIIAQSLAIFKKIFFLKKRTKNIFFNQTMESVINHFKY